MPRDPAILHVYPQWWPHDPVYIVGNREGLGQLAISAIEAQRQGQAEAELCAGDGEGFHVHLIRADWDQVRQLALPYADQIFQETGRQNPWGLWKKEP